MTYRKSNGIMKITNTSIGWKGEGVRSGFFCLVVLVWFCLVFFVFFILTYSLNIVFILGVSGGWIT